MNEALTVLGYFEIPDEKEQPPELIWGNDDALTAWFEDVKFRREHPDNQPVEQVDMQQNDLTRRLLGG